MNNSDFKIESTSLALETPSPVPIHSIFPKWQRIAIVYIASLAAFASPVSSNIYLPAMLSIADELNVSLTKISLTITVYMIFQGVAPTITGGISDRIGRRPTYFICFTLFIASSIGLALQTNFAALLVLRCVQSCGSSGTTVLSSAAVSDIATRQERGSYIGLAALGVSMGPAVGPLIGGLLTHFLGWRSVFWFLATFGGVMLFVYILFIPETCRNIVGDGSLAPQVWNKPLIQGLPWKDSKRCTVEPPLPIQTEVPKKRPGFLATLPILLDKETFLILLFSGIVYAGYYIVLTSLPQQLSASYHFNSIQIGLCFLPIGLGPLLIRAVIGTIMDFNFRRHARRLGIEVVKNRQADIEGFPIEWARLQISLTLVYLTAIVLIPYGWVMSLHHPPLPAILILLFIMGASLAATLQPIPALTIDLHPKSPAAATAAGQFIRCLLGAGGVALVNPMLENLGPGWTGTVVAAVLIVMSGCWWAVVVWGPEWRKAQKAEDT